MITYKSTRGSKKTYTFSEAVLKGLADDGGLLVPERIPSFSLNNLKKLIGKSYAEKALFVLDLFETDLSRNLLRTVTEKAYGKQGYFTDKKVTPLRHLKENHYILELWHGPTWAYKDVSLQLMPFLFSEAIKMDNKKRLKKKQKSLQYLILVATSGDTGKAALEGYKNKEHIFVIVFFPDKRISSIQRLSMVTQEGHNVGVYRVQGNFDDTQKLVKTIFTDKAMNEKLYEKYDTSLSAANSINWGRFLPQVVYHLSSYIELIEKKVIKLGDQIDIAVPSGNFSSMLAAYVAKCMGLPVRTLICASNANNVLTEFLQTGTFNAAKRIIIKTPSPAMDILAPSNIERLLYFLSNDSRQILHWMAEAKRVGKFTVDEKTKQQLQEIFYAEWTNNKDCLQTIYNTFHETQYLIDPHTAVVKRVVHLYKERKSIPLIICSTAHWSKFPNDVYKALFKNKKHTLDEFGMITYIEKYTKSSVPQNLFELKEKGILYNDILQGSTKEAEDEILAFLGKKKELL